MVVTLDNAITVHALMLVISIIVAVFGRRHRTGIGCRCLFWCAGDALGCGGKVTRALMAGTGYVSEWLAN